MCFARSGRSFQLDGVNTTFDDGENTVLSAGSHTLLDESSSTALNLEIVDGTDTIVEVSFAIAPVPTDTPVPAPTDTPEPIATETPAPTATATLPATGTVKVVTHLCAQGIYQPGDLEALDWTHQLLSCPSVVLPDDFASIPADNVKSDPAEFDISFAYAADGTPTTVSLADAVFGQDNICEDTLGNLNGVSTDNHCWDQSGYQVEDATPGDVTLTANALPTGFTFGAATTDPATDDTGAIGNVDPDTGIITLETSSDNDVTIHLFAVPTPVQKQITVVMHLCGSAIDSRAKFNALGAYSGQNQCLPLDRPPRRCASPGRRYIWYARTHDHHSGCRFGHAIDRRCPVHPSSCLRIGSPCRYQWRRY